MPPCCAQTLADARIHTGVQKRDRPISGIAGEKLHFLRTLIQGEIVREPLVVVKKVALDHFSSVSKAKNELRVTEMGIVAHHMPKDWTRSDRYHRLWYVLPGLTDPQPKTTA